MMNILDDKLAEIRKTAAEQSNRIASEVNASADGLNAAMIRFNTTMTQARLKREEADALEAAAVRELDTALTNSQAIQLGIVQQIADGRVVTGSAVPVIPARKPKLVQSEEAPQTAVGQ